MNDAEQRAYAQGYERGWRESEDAKPPLGLLCSWAFCMGTYFGWIFGVAIEHWLLSVIALFAVDVAIIAYSGKD